MPRLVRRRPTIQRIKDYLNPGDFLLYVSEEFETRDWDSKQFATPLALVLHISLLIARANTGTSLGSGQDDVFGDDYSGTGWLSYIATLVVWTLSIFSITNATYTFTRKRHYRLFELDIDQSQSTPSAQRVRVDSSPVSSSPLRLLTSILGDTSAESRAHPDATRDVWEIATWDPIPICLRLFCFFSPGHVLVYWLFLPIVAADPRPSVTVFTTILLQVLLSSQLCILQVYFSQQEKDTSIIQKEVMSEYNIKYVHPRLNPLVRDVATQYSDAGTGTEYEGDGEVDIYTPSVILKRGFRTNPNPNYAKHVDPDNSTVISRQSSPAPFYTRSAFNSRESTPLTGTTPRPPIRQPQFRKSMGGAVVHSTTPSTGDGGSLGVYSHVNSPLKKATSMYDIQSRDSPRNSFDMATREVREGRERSKSPEKRQSEAHRSLLQGRAPFPDVIDDRRTSVPSTGLNRRPGPSAFDSPTPSPTHQRRSSSWHANSLFRKRAKSPPPAALTTQADRRRGGHRRSTSLSEGLKRLLPSQRAEKGGTLRARDEDFDFENGDGGGILEDGTTMGGMAPAKDGAVAAPRAAGGEGGVPVRRQLFLGLSRDRPSLSPHSGYTLGLHDRSRRHWDSADQRSHPIPNWIESRAYKGKPFVDTGAHQPDSESQHTADYNAAGADPHYPARISGAARSTESTHHQFAFGTGSGYHKKFGADVPGQERYDYSPDNTERPATFCPDHGAPGTDLESGIETEASVSRNGADTRRRGRAGGRVAPGSETVGRDEGRRGSIGRSGLKNLFGSWGKKVKVEDPTESPEIYHLSKPLPALPPVLVISRQDVDLQMPSFSGVSDQKETTVAQQIFEDKKSRRQQRRSLKDSGDYLGVQGANPRTGYWDVSSGSEPSQMSDETKRKLDEEARKVAEQKSRYEEAESKHRLELERVMSMRENKKKLEQKIKQRRRGKWKLSENGWSSVAEPDLSPIVQSQAGTPVVEVAPGDRLFPMPTAADPAPYAEAPKTIRPRDYFGHRPDSSPLIQERLSSKSSERASEHSIRRKAVGSPSRRRGNESSATTVHHPVLSSPLRTRPVQAPPNALESSGEDASPKAVANGSPRATRLTAMRSPSRRLESFLDKAIQMQASEEPQERRASAISFQSVSTKQVHIHPPSARNPRNMSRQAKVITCLNELPPVTLKDPFEARIPSSYPVKGSYAVWMPPTLIKAEPDSRRLFTSTCITTTTGLDPHQRPPAQTDGPDDLDRDSTSEDRVRFAAPGLHHKPSRIPRWADSSPNNQPPQREEPSSGYPTRIAATGTSSEPQLEEIKRRTVRLCQMASAGGERVEMKSKPMSISTSLGPEEEKQAARNAARMAFQHLKQNISPPSTRKNGSDEKKGPYGEHNIVRSGNGDTGSHLRIKDEATREPEPSSERKKVSVLVPIIRHGASSVDQNRAVSAPPLPKVGTAGTAEKGTGKGCKDPDKRVAATAQHQDGASPVPPMAQKARVQQLSIDQVILGLLHGAWLFVEPAFNPDSAVRKRFEGQCLTYTDVGLFAAAAMFLAGGLLGVLLLVRLVSLLAAAARGVAALIGVLVAG
ncbi:hypothetical protein BUE80_DR005000 [Diplocarpon rosae]|nr:hypothetical protein BUE80_DR005000 [Diplocarpon rosae]